MSRVYSEIKAGRPRLGRGLVGLAVAVLIAFLILPGTVAFAEFKVCNQSLTLYNIAVGTEKDGAFQTEGWWTLSANDCVSPITDDLASRFVYVFATNIYGDDVVKGETTMCINRRAHFMITGTDNCWLRGYEEAKFKEVDTRSSTSWTVFIRENQD